MQDGVTKVKAVKGGSYSESRNYFNILFIPAVSELQLYVLV